MPAKPTSWLRWLFSTAALLLPLLSMLTLPVAPADEGCEPEGRLPEPVLRLMTDS